MIFFCDYCGTIKTRDDFDNFYTYEENMCKDCKERDPKDEGLAEEYFEEISRRQINQMMFGEEDIGFLSNEEEFVYDGEIDEDDKEEN
jgi:hypothetical protein